MTIVLDSSIVIDLLRGYEPAIAYGRSLSELPFCSEITRVEVMRGLRSPERAAAERLFAAIAWVVIDEVVDLGLWRDAHDVLPLTRWRSLSEIPRWEQRVLDPGQIMTIFVGIPSNKCQCRRYERPDLPRNTSVTSSATCCSRSRM